MLYLNPPYYSIDGVTLLPDHVDPLQFYYMPMSPQLSTFEDQTENKIIPKIQVIKFAGSPGLGQDPITGGFLDFDCNIGITEEQRITIAEKLQSEANLTDLPRLHPVPVIDGSVKMMLFGSKTPDEESAGLGRPGAAEVPEEFVLDIVHNAKPSLYGNNQAAFSVRLDQAGVTILERALQGELSPIGIVYSLEYVGLRPAYNIRVEAEWDRVQTHIEKSEKVSVPLFASSSVEEVIDELIEEQMIRIESDLLIADGEEDGGASGRHEAAMAQIRELVFENFFEPSLEPMDREGGDVIDDFGRVLRTVATHGFESVWSKKEVDLTRIDRKKLNIDLSERTSVIKEIHPQGHLVGIGRTIAEQGLDLDRFIMSVPLGDPFFNQRKVRVIPRIDFATDLIESVNVSLDYDGSVKNVVFDATTAEQEVIWPSSLDGDRMRSDVTVSYETTFANTAVGRPRSLRSQPEVIDGEVFEVSPRADIPYELRWISFNVIDFPWNIYYTAEVHCAYVDEANGIDIRNHYGLTYEFPDGAWPVFAMDPSHRNVRYRVILHGYDGRDWESQWIETDEDQIKITDPFSQRRTLDIVVPSSLFGTMFDRVFVDVAYSDPANEIEKRESFELNAGDSATKRFMVELADQSNRLVSFRVTMLMTDGTVVEVPESTTNHDRLIVSPNMRGHRTVAISTDGSSFERARMRAIRVLTRYVRPEAGLHFEGDVNLTDASPASSFEFDFAANDEVYEYRVIHQFQNGLSRDSDWQRSSSDQIVVELD